MLCVLSFVMNLGWILVGLKWLSMLLVLLWLVEWKWKIFCMVIILFFILVIFEIDSILCWLLLSWLIWMMIWMVVVICVWVELGGMLMLFILIICLMCVSVLCGVLVWIVVIDLLCLVFIVWSMLKVLLV